MKDNTTKLPLIWSAKNSQALLLALSREIKNLLTLIVKTHRIEGIPTGTASSDRRQNKNLDLPIAFNFFETKYLLEVAK